MFEWINGWKFEKLVKDGLSKKKSTCTHFVVKLKNIKEKEKLLKNSLKEQKGSF
jgi:hypothetical protein